MVQSSLSRWQSSCALWPRVPSEHFDSKYIIMSHSDGMWLFQCRLVSLQHRLHLVWGQLCGCISPCSYWTHSDLSDTLSHMQEMPPNCPYLPLDEQWNNTKERGFIGSAAAAVLGNVQAQLKTLAHDASDGNASFVSLHAVDSMYQKSQLPKESSKHSQVLHSTPAVSVHEQETSTCILLPSIPAGRHTFQSCKVLMHVPGKMDLVAHLNRGQDIHGLLQTLL